MKTKVFIPEKKSGIWLDHEHAYVFQINEHYQYEVSTIFSEIAEKDTLKEEKKTSRFKRMFFNQDKEQRRQHQYMLKFFENILNQIRNCDYVYVFGPGNSKHEFKHFIEKVGKKFDLKVTAVETVDKMTVPQMLAHVKDYFRSLSFEDFQRQLLSS